MAARFVILHHTSAEGEHWDLMLECGDTLLTWQLLTDPLAWFASVERPRVGEGTPPGPIPARRIGDHRKVYLEYEGRISGDRGHVRRVDDGTMTLVERTERRCEVVLNGRRMTGRFVLELREGEWVLKQ